MSLGKGKKKYIYIYIDKYLSFKSQRSEIFLKDTKG